MTRPRRAGLGVILAAALLVLAWPAAANAQATITTAGALTQITITPDLNCDVRHISDTSPEFFGSTACGTLVATGGTLFGPASIPAGGSASPRTPFTPVSQTGPLGSGTAGDPFRIITVVGLPGTSLTLTETDSYVAGTESYRTDVTVSNGGGGSSGIVYRAGDCFLQESDSGFGSVNPAAGSVACVGVTPAGTPSSRIEQWDPLTPGSSYFHANYDEVWARIGAQLPFPNTCRCSELIDNGAGLSWSVAFPAGGSSTVSHLTTFSPTGQVPPTVALTLTPGTDTNPVGTQHSVTATLTTGGSATAAAAILFSVTGANPGSGSGTTGAAGTASFTYTGANAGVDTITACNDANTNGTCDAGEQSATATKLWVGDGKPTKAVDLSPSEGSMTAGASDMLTATLTVAGTDIPVESVQVVFYVMGVNGQSVAIMTDSEGRASFELAGLNAGLDWILACYDVNGNASCDEGESHAWAWREWLPEG